jgi:hypothetical protein
MPFTMKATWIFSGPDHGFTESLFFQWPTGDLVAASDFVYNQVTTKRRPLLGAQHSIKAQRVSVEFSDAGLPVRNDSRLVKFFLPGTAAQASAPNNVSLQVQFADSTSRRKKLMFMGGMWRSINPADDILDTSAGAFLSFFNTWKTSLISNGFGWIGTTDKRRAAVTNYTSTPAEVVTVTYAGAPITWPATDRPIPVTFSGINVHSVLNGPQVITPSGANTVTLLKPIATGPFVSPGWINYNIKSFISLASPGNGAATGTVEAQNPMTRERGRPLLVSVGRARAKART